MVKPLILMIFERVGVLHRFSVLTPMYCFFVPSSCCITPTHPPVNFLHLFTILEPCSSVYLYTEIAGNRKVTFFTCLLKESFLLVHPHRPILGQSACVLTGKVHVPSESWFLRVLHVENDQAATTSPADLVFHGRKSGYPDRKEASGLSTYWR